jgi:ATP-dependent Zn protease
MCCRGYSGAQLANLVNMAATVAASAGRNEICVSDLEKVRGSWGQVRPLSSHPVFVMP